MTCVPVTRETIGWRAVPKREYRCHLCQELYEHDKGYWHNLFICQKRARALERKDNNGTMGTTRPH